MIFLLIALGLLCLAFFVALFLWARRSEADIDYAEMRDESTQTDDQRRAEQLGIGLTSGPTLFGPQ